MNTTRKEMSVIECILLAVCPVFVLWNGWNLLWEYWGKGFFWRFFPGNIEQASYTVRFLTFAVLMLLFFSIWYWFGSTRKRERWGGFGWNSLRPDILVLSAVMGLLLQRITVAYLLNSAGLNASLFNDFYEKYSQISRSSLPGILALAILIPIVEELAFRGLTFGYLAKILPFWVANVMQALLFALYHQTPLQAGFAFVCGLFMGWLLYRTWHLRNCVIAHMVFNYLFMPMSAKLSGYNGFLENIVAVISIVLLAGICMLIHRISGKKRS